MSDSLKNDLAFWTKVAYFWKTEFSTVSTEPLCEYEIPKSCVLPINKIKQELMEDDSDDEDDSFEEDFFSRL